jgi:hypothetical protein
MKSVTYCQLIHGQALRSDRTVCRKQESSFFRQLAFMASGFELKPHCYGVNQTSETLALLYAYSLNKN